MHGGVFDHDSPNFNFIIVFARVINHFYREAAAENNLVLQSRAAFSIEVSFAIDQTGAAFFTIAHSFTFAYFSFFSLR